MEARPHHGLILGKFLPPHEGHLFLIREAARRVERLTVLVCSIEREPIPGALRAQWMRELAPFADVIHVTDENPQYPHEDPDFWPIWIATVRRHVAQPVDVVFTSEAYGDELAQRLGAVHEQVDLARDAFPVSGTAVRNDPWSNWQFIPPVVRPYFVRRVVLIGSECTGKTTLAARLAERFGTVWVPEYGRTFVAQYGLPRNLVDVEAIARGQIASEDAMARKAERLLILDTDLFSTVVYSRHYYGDVPAWIEEAAVARKADLYLLADIDVPWVADGEQRDRGDRREEMQELFREILRKHGIQWTDVRGSAEEREERAASVIKRRN